MLRHTSSDHHIRILAKDHWEASIIADGDVVACSDAAARFTKITALSANQLTLLTDESRLHLVLREFAICIDYAREKRLGGFAKRLGWKTFPAVRVIYHCAPISIPLIQE